MAKDFYQPLYNDEVLTETAGISLAASGAYLKFKAKCWNAATRGELCRDLMGYAQLFGCTVDQAKRSIDELTAGDTPVLSRSDCPDGTIRLTHEATRHRDQVSRVRSVAKKSKPVCEGFDTTKVDQNSNKPLDVDLDVSNPGGVGGDDPPVVADVSDEIDDDEFQEWPLDRKVRVWLNRMPRFPLVNTSPKDVSTVVRMTEKWGWDYVKQCIGTAIDNGADRIVPYAQTVAESTAAKAFATKPKPVMAGAKPSRNWRPG